MQARLKYLAGILALAVLYILAAKLGLSLALSVKQITTVWPPSGLALAALVIYGYRMWPGVFLGAFVANLLTNEPVAVATGIAAGNTLEAILGAILVLRIIDIRKELSRIKDVIGLALLAAFISTMVAATIGTTSLALGHLLAWSAQPKAWLLWWFGDMSGDLLFAPFLMVWFVGWRKPTWLNYRELIILLISTVAVTAVIFFGRLSYLGNHPPVPYLTFPFVIWAAIRLKQLGVTAVSLAISIIAILGTVAGQGPFAGSGTIEQQLIFLLPYIILITVSGLCMGAAVMQREEYALELTRQSEELKIARDRIKKELSVTTRRAQRLEKSHQHIIRILDDLLGVPKQP
jgi:two-component system, NarL family, sensor histidine kinase FusK